MFIITEDYFEGDCVGAKSCDCPEMSMASMEDIKNLMPNEFRILKADMLMDVELFRGFCSSFDDEDAYEPLDWQEMLAGGDLIDYKIGEFWWRLIDRYE